MNCHRLLTLLMGILVCVYVHAQQTHSTTSDSNQTVISSKYLSAVSSKTNSIDEKLTRKSEQVLRRLMKLEDKAQNKLMKTDSLKATQVFGNSKENYQQLQERLSARISSRKSYIPSLDTLSSSLKFLQQSPALLASTKDIRQKLSGSLAKVNGLENKFRQADEIKKFIKERRQYLKQQLSQLGFAKQLKTINKQAYYYSAQVNEYKNLLSDHKKAERKALALLSKTKLFKDFMRKNSQLASLFRLPGDPNDPLAQANLAGLQTRAQVSNLIQQQVSSGGSNAQWQVQQNMQAGQAQLDQLKSKVTKLGGSSSDADMPDGFRPNEQRKKSFLKRLEPGTNFQSQHASGFFPTTSDLGVSLGYKLNDKSIIGIGGSYKMGWGRNIRHMKISHQGVGLRSFIDWKIKGSFWLTGGYEMNYRSEFHQIDELKDLDAWQRSGLIGVSKLIPLKTKMFKNTKVQLLWDFLSERQVPRTQAVVFRVGYVF
jgi:hypothetical protein